MTIPTAPPPYEEPLPFTLYSAHDGVPLATEVAGPIPNKANPSSLPIPVPPYPEDGGISTENPQSSNCEPVDTGYFGASVSAVSITQDDQQPTEEFKERPDNDLSVLHRRDNSNPDTTGISNPAFDDLGAVGYFGATANESSSAKI